MATEGRMTWQTAAEKAFDSDGRSVAAIAPHPRRQRCLWQFLSVQVTAD
jgi:hypothetical protein